MRTFPADRMAAPGGTPAPQPPARDSTCALPATCTWPATQSAQGGSKTRTPDVLNCRIAWILRCALAADALLGDQPTACTVRSVGVVPAATCTVNPPGIPTV